ncbi:MAG: PEP-CTERM sorting domain-containing protein [Planctomycetia bacterium]|nr:PEP-CTERM sorting domain-containing protein [Planctomycetia bacterium]
MKTSYVCLVATIIFGSSAHFALAEDVHYDVFVTASGTSLIIGGYDDANTVAIVPEGQLRVFGGEVVGTGTAAAFESSAPGEPGFRASTQSNLNNPSLTTPANMYTALPGLAPLTFNFQPITIAASTRNLYFWDGSGSVAFSPVGANVVLGLEKQGAGGWTSSIDGSAAGVLAGNTIQTTGSTGSVHTHLYTSLAKSGAAPDQGFYLYSLQLQMTGYTPSDSLYFVFGALDPTALAPQFADLVAFEAAHGLAEGWVESNLVAVPEPSSIALAGLGIGSVAFAALRRRMRKQ